MVILAFNLSSCHNGTKALTQNAEEEEHYCHVTVLCLQTSVIFCFHWEITSLFLYVCMLLCRPPAIQDSEERCIYTTPLSLYLLISSVNELAVVTHRDRKTLNLCLEAHLFLTSICVDFKNCGNVEQKGIFSKVILALLNVQDFLVKLNLDVS